MPKSARQLLIDGGEDGDPVICVNEEYARRFEHNKRREELHRLQEKHPELAARLARKAATEAIKAARPSKARVAAAGAGTAGANRRFADNGDEESEEADDEDEDEDEESSSDDEDDEELDALDDTDKVLETLVKIKQHDPVIYKKDVILFPEQAAQPENGDAAASASAGKKSKPMFLRTVLAQQALEGGPMSSDDEPEEDQGDGGPGPGPGALGLPRLPQPDSYAAEQQELKAAFLAAAEAADDDGGDDDSGVIKKRPTAADGQVAAGAPGGDKGQQVTQLLDEYFGKDEELDQAGAFLKAYLAKKAWKEPKDADLAAAAGVAGSRRQQRIRLSESGDEDDDGDDDGAGGAAPDDDEDEEFLENVDRFEAAYNFRFEEPGAAAIQSYPRVIEGSVRRADERRKRQRDAKAARQAAEKAEQAVELRRLKNLKKAEIQDMLSRIHQEAGIKSEDAAGAGPSKQTALKGKGKQGGAGGAGLVSLMDELLEGEFDPEEYDRRMAAAFDDDYYEGDDDPEELFGGAEEELLHDEAEVDGIAATDAAYASDDDDDDDDAAATGGSAGPVGDTDAVASTVSEQHQHQGFAALRQKLKELQQGAGAVEAVPQSNGGEVPPAAAAAAGVRSQLQQLLDDYYKLDYEDNIGGLACRFKYSQVATESFGLSADDVLTLSDKQLNQIAGLKLIAPYREGYKKMRPNYKALQSIKGEAAAADMLRQQKKERQKRKDRQKKEEKKTLQQQQQQQQPPQVDGQKRQSSAADGPQQHKHKSGKQYHHGKQHWQGHKKQGQSQPHKQQQQQVKSLADMTAEERKAARLASYAKLTLKPSKEAAHQQQQQPQHHQGGGKHGKKRKAADGEDAAAAGAGKKQKQQPAPGRLAQVQVPDGLTKAQKKNLIRTLKRKEKSSQQQ